MDTSLKKFREKLLSELLKFLWDRWSDLGISGQVRIKDDRIIDPDALFLFSLTIARFDARLFDEILDWMRVNSNFLNVQRLQNLIKIYGFSGGPALSAAARLLQESGPYRLKWKKIAAAFKTTNEPLFKFPTGEPLPLPPATDTNFAACGLQRGKILLRGKSKTFPDKGSSSLILRLRGLIGISIRCELLALLAAEEESYPSEAARQTCYYQRSVLDALNEMAHSGAVRLVMVGKTKRYRLTPGILDGLLAPDGKRPEWVSWGPLFRALEMILQKLYDSRMEQCDPLLLSSEMRQLMMSVRPLLETAGYGRLVTEPASYLGSSYLEVFYNDVDKIVSVSVNNSV